MNDLSDKKVKAEFKKYFKSKFNISLSDNDINDVKSILDMNNTCLNCGSVFIRNHLKKKFCSDKCRVEHWEKEKGVKLIFRPKGTTVIGIK